MQQLHTDIDWTATDWLEVRGGYQYVGEHDDARARSDFPNNHWQAYAGYGPASNNNGAHGAALPQVAVHHHHSHYNFIQGYGGSSNLPPQLLALQRLWRAELPAEPGQSPDHAIPGFNTGCCDPAFTGIYQLTDVASDYSQVIENTHAVYLNALARTTVAGMPLKINAGLARHPHECHQYRTGPATDGTDGAAVRSYGFSGRFRPGLGDPGANDYTYAAAKSGSDAGGQR